MTTRITQNSVGMAVAVGLFIGLCCNKCLASETCKNNSGSTKHVCVAWDRELAPVEGTDFEVNYGCQGCSDDPAITLTTGDDEWEVWSEVISTGTPANIGSLTTTDANNYTVTIANGTNAGATNIASMELAPNGAAYYSSLGSGSKISGDLTGELSLQKSTGGTGGTASFTVGGDVLGDVTIPEVSSFNVTGGVAAGVTITIGDVVGDKDLSFGGSFAGTLLFPNGVDDSQAMLEFSSELASTATIDFNDHALAGWLWLYNGAAAGSVVTASDMGGYLDLGGDFAGSATFGTISGSISFEGADLTGSIEVPGDVSGSLYMLGCGVATTGTIQFDGDLTGDIILVEGGGIGGNLDGAITIDGNAPDGSQIYIPGAVTGSLTIWGDAGGDTEMGILAGTAIFDDISGSVAITEEISAGGYLRIDGTVADGASITIADQAGTGHHIDFFPPSVLAGHLTLESGLKEDQRLYVETVGETGWVDFNDQDVSGIVYIKRTSNGTVTGGTVRGSGRVSFNTFGGEATFAGVDAGARVFTYPTAAYTGDLLGTIHVQNNMDGYLTVDGNLGDPDPERSVGRITVGADVGGAISVTGDTLPGSQIKMPEGTLAGTLTISGDVGGHIGIGNLTGYANFGRSLPGSEIDIFGGVWGSLTISADVGGEIGIGTLHGYASLGGSLPGSQIDIPGIVWGTLITSGDAGGETNIGRLFGLASFEDISGSVAITDRIEGGGSLTIYGTVSDGASITVKDQTGIGKQIDFGVHSVLAGDLTLESGLKEDQELAIENMASTGSVDFNGQDIAGTFNNWNGTSGTITGGNITEDGDVMIAYSHEFAGIATFGDVFGYLRTSNSDLSRTIQVGTVYGTVRVSGHVIDDGEINISGHVTTDGEIRVTGNLLADGQLKVNGDVSGYVGVLGGADGDIVVQGDVSGEIYVALDITGSVTVAGVFNGDICAANLSPGSPLPPNIDIYFGPSGTICGQFPALPVVTPAPAPEAGAGVETCTVPGNCAGAYAGADCVAGLCYIPKNRHLSIDPSVNRAAVAYEVKLIDSGPYRSAEGRTWWLGEPQCYGYPDGEVVLPAPETCEGTDRFGWVAELETMEVYRAWQEAPVHVTGCGIVPVATYAIRAFDQQATQSEDLVIATAHQPEGPAQTWGDITGGPVPGMPPLWLAPEGATNFGDVSAAIATYENRTEGTGSPPRVWIDVEANCVINLADIQFIISAFQGTAYADLPDLAFIGWHPAECTSVGEGLAGGQPEDGGEESDDLEGGDEMDGGDSTVAFAVVADPGLIEAEETVEVHVFLDSVDDLRTYQVKVTVSGGDAGSFALDGLEIDTEREDFVFGEDDIVAGLDESGGRLGAVRMDGGVNVTGPVYLGTFTFRASPDAEGVFDVAVDDGIHSFLRDSDGVEISSAAGDEVNVGVDVECFTDEHCDDDNDCTTDTCESYECAHTNKTSGTPCDDGLYCTETDECDGNGTCVGTGNPCGVKAPKCCEDTDQCVDAQAQCPSGT